MSERYCFDCGAEYGEHSSECFQKPKEGFIRIYEDHTHRNWTDYSHTAWAEMQKDPLMTILREAVQEEINKEIIKKI